MKEYFCKKDFYIEGVLFAQKGDHVVLMSDGRTVVNASRNSQKVVEMPEIVGDKEYFIPTFELAYNNNAPKEDLVNHPKHYSWLKDKCGIEVIDITRWLDFDLGNAVKYLLRAGKKTESNMSDNEKTIQDLKKAIWYIQDKIKQLEYGNNI